VSTGREGANEEESCTGILFLKLKLQIKISALDVKAHPKKIAKIKPEYSDAVACTMMVPSDRPCVRI
jgi:hypothetical protein